MPSSFVAGAEKIRAGKEPRFLVLSGNEYNLKEHALEQLGSRQDYSYSTTGNADEFERLAFMQAERSLNTHMVILRDAKKGSWDWLPLWFNRVKNVRLVVETSSSVLTNDLTKRANTRGMVVDCSAPRSEAARAKLAKYLAGHYSHSITQVSLLLHKADWQISECMELMDKLALLNLPLTSDTILKVGLARNPVTEFVEALSRNEAATAMTVIARIPEDQYPTVLVELTQWWDRLARLKGAVSYMKSVRDLAFELGEDKQTIESLLKYSRRFEYGQLNKIALALAAADREVSRGIRRGVLEMVVSKWQ